MLAYGEFVHDWFGVQGGCEGLCGEELQVDLRQPVVPRLAVGPNTPLGPGGQHRTLGGALSAKVAALSEGEVNAMILTKLRIAGLVCLTQALLGSGLGLLAPPALSAQPSAAKKESKPAAGDNFAALHRMILPQPGELKWAEFPWLTSITLARHRAAVENKPLLIFLDTGAGFADVLGMC
jgi:hypothetical protein